MCNVTITITMHELNWCRLIQIEYLYLYFISEQIRRVFVDNPPTGTCKKCGHYPSSREDSFLCLKLTIPESNGGVHLSSLIDDYFSESVGNVKMKCSFCCEHEQMKVPCPQTGFCGRQAVTRHELSKTPKYLFIQLLRFRHDTGVKVMTHVKVATRLKLPNNANYEPVAFLNHKGFIKTAGHYVVYIKNESGQWILFDDINITPASFEAANTTENYVLMFKQIGSLDNLQHNLPQQPSVSPTQCWSGKTKRCRSCDKVIPVSVLSIHEESCS